MVREDLIQSAVSFLQDPSVATSTLEQRISFLRSKNLTQEEVDESLARAGDGSSVKSLPPPLPAGQPRSGYPNQQGYGYGQYQRSPWGPPPDIPGRDWRDWFIMATVSSGVGYGLYLAAKRYVLPLILPPTPPQLASDKASIDESFSRAFALIDQLTSDTASLKSSEAERTEKLDSTLRDVESVISDLKAANIRREAESRILADQVHGLKEMVPKALDGWKASGDGRLEELATELRSLKKLVGNRMGSTNSQPPLNRTYQGISAKDRTYTGVASIPTMIGGNGDLQENLPGSPAPAPGVVSPKRENAGGYQSSGKATIPAWQMADAGEKGLGGTSGKGESTIADSGT